MNKVLIKTLTIILILNAAIQAKRSHHRAKIDTKTFTPHAKHIDNSVRLMKIAKASQSPADIQFNENPEGTDKYEEILEGDVFLMNTKTSKISPTQKDEFQLEYLRLNRHAIYYTQAEKTYRGVVGSIQLQDLLTAEDVPKKGKCCNSISDKIEKKQIQFDGDLSEIAFDCFQLTSKNEKWDLCFPKFSQASEWKKKITQNIITQSLEKEGIYGLNFITEAPKQPTKYTWLDQSVWGGDCIRGDIQSPAKISNSQALQQDNLRMRFQFSQQASSVIAKFDGQQMNVLGNFGSFSYQQNTLLRTFEINKLQFKFPSEHIVNKKRYDGEILVFGKKIGGDNTAILSFMVEMDKDMERNKFIDQLNVENWVVKQGEQQGVPIIDPELSLENIVTGEGGIEKNFRKSFFFYMGSYSDPPCEQGVYRFVMTQPIKMTPKQFEDVKIHSYFTSEETNGNARDAQDFSPKRTLYYHVDKSDGCDNGFIAKIRQAKKEEKEKEEEKINKPEEKKDECEQEKADKKYVKATTSVTTYAITDQASLPVGDFGNGLDLKKIDEKEVPQAILQRLQSQAKAIDEKNCNKKHKKVSKQQTLNSLIN